MRSKLLFRMQVSPKTVADRRRRRVLEFWRERVLALEPRERKLHRNLVPEIERIVYKKRLFLFKEMLEAAEYPSSKDLVFYMYSGFPLMEGVLHSGA